MATVQLGLFAVAGLVSLFRFLVSFVSESRHHGKNETKNITLPGI